jgi:hypothetical protein
MIFYCPEAFPQLTRRYRSYLTGLHHTVDWRSSHWYSRIRLCRFGSMVAVKLFLWFKAAVALVCRFGI